MEKHTSIQLRIKLLSLASEARHIRRWERRLLAAARAGKGADAKARFWSIRNHRKDDIAPEARNTLLAFGFLRGMPYKRMEPRRYSDPDWTNICRMAVEYRGSYEGDLTADFKAWRAAAGEPLKRFPSNQPPTPAPNPTPAASTKSESAAPVPERRKRILGIF